MKMNRQILSLGETLVYLHLEKLCLFWSIQFYCRGKRNRKLITITLIIITTIICIVGSVLDSGTCFWILGRVFGFWDVFWILGRVFGFWDVFLDSGKCYLDSGMCFWILRSALDSGKRFSFWEVCSSFLLTSGSPFSVLSATCQPSKPFSP